MADLPAKDQGAKVSKGQVRLHRETAVCSCCGVEFVAWRGGLGRPVERCGYCRLGRRRGHLRRR